MDFYRHLINTIQKCVQYFGGMLEGKIVICGDEMKTYTVGDCFYYIQNGANIKQGVINGGFPITRIETISNGRFNRDRMGYAGIKDISKYRQYVLEDGDLLMSHINSVQYLGRTVLYQKNNDEIIIHGMNLLKLKADRDIIVPAYAKYYFDSNPFKEQLRRITKKSVNQASFTVNDLKRLIIQCPDISEQVEIISKLDMVKHIIMLRQQEINRLDELVKARFVEMFGTYPANEMGWCTGTIRDVISEARYGSSRPAVEGGQYPYLRMNNITYDGELDLSDIKRIDVPDSELEKCTVRQGDVLFNRTNSKELVGKTCVYNCDEMMVLAGFVIRIRVNSRVLPVFLSSFMNTDFSKQMLLGMCRTAVGQANINAKELQDIGLYIPPIDLQQKFIDFKLQIDKSKLLEARQVGFIAKTGRQISFCR